MSFLLGFAREVANVTIAPIAIPRFPGIINESFGGAAPVVNFTRPDITNATVNTLMIYPDAIGIMAYIIIALIPFAMMVISQGNTKMASIVGCIVMAFVGLYVGGVYLTVGWIIIALTVVVTIYGIFKGGTA